MTDGPDSSRLLRALRHTANLLDTRGAPWALVGGLAVSIRAEPRFTRDIDLAVGVATDAAAEALVADLTAAGFSLQLSLEQQALGRLATVRLLPPGETDEGILVDLLFASSGIETAICEDADRIEVAPGLVVPVATVGHLFVTKLLALAPDRPQDAADLQALARHLTPEDEDRARGAAARIELLGANRAKALRDELEQWLSSSRL